MNHSLKSLFFLFFITLTSLYSQNNSIKLFLKCSCDSNYIRDQINYIDYVRDQEDANIILDSLVYKNTLISVYKNYRYEREDLLFKEPVYIKLFDLSCKMDRNIRTSHDIV